MTLHMIRVELLTDRLMNIGLRKKLPMHQVDTGYLVHCQLAELFGDDSPRPFFVDTGAGRKIAVLGYSALDSAALEQRAERCEPALREAVLWPELASKPMPGAWRAGQKLGFGVRACPIVRTKAPGQAERRVKNGRAVSREVDAFLHACWQAGPDVRLDREQVYRDWLGRQLEASGGARLVETRVVAMQRERLSRRTHEAERKAHTCERPDVTFEGVLEVTDAATFGELLRRGVGRHRAFGFGMLRLRPV